MSIEKAKVKLANLLDSKSHNETRILELSVEAKILRQKLHLED
jgi:hypothetical protein